MERCRPCARVRRRKQTGCVASSYVSATQHGETESCRVRFKRSEREPGLGVMERVHLRGSEPPRAISGLGCGGSTMQGSGP
jgi:hypothetical protein